MTRLLITGFGPFPGAPRNPSETLAQGLAADRRWRRVGVEATALVLPTTYAAIESMLLPALRDHAPDAVLMLGVAARRRAVCLEARATDRTTRRLADASGRPPAARASRSGTPPVRRARAPIRVLAAAMRAAAPGRTRLSRDAGRYVCNAAAFAALGEDGPAAVVFVHVPMPRAGVGRPLREGVRPRASTAETRRAIIAAACALARAARRRRSRA